MKIFLLVTLLLAGADQPIQKMEEQPDMQVCEAAAHKYNIAKIPDEMVMASAACLRIKPDLPGKPT